MKSLILIVVITAPLFGQVDNPNSAAPLDFDNKFRLAVADAEATTLFSYDEAPMVPMVDFPMTLDEDEFGDIGGLTIVFDEDTNLNLAAGYYRINDSMDPDDPSLPFGLGMITFVDIEIDSYTDATTCIPRVNRFFVAGETDFTDIGLPMVGVRVDAHQELIMSDLGGYAGSDATRKMKHAAEYDGMNVQSIRGSWFDTYAPPHDPAFVHLIPYMNWDPAAGPIATTAQYKIVMPLKCTVVDKVKYGEGPLVEFDSDHDTEIKNWTTGAGGGSYAKAVYDPGAKTWAVTYKLRLHPTLQQLLNQEWQIGSITVAGDSIDLTYTTWEDHAIGAQGTKSPQWSICSKVDCENHKFEVETENGEGAAVESVYSADVKAQIMGVHLPGDQYEAHVNPNITFPLFSG